MVYNSFDKKARSGTKVNVNASSIISDSSDLKNSKEKKCVRGLKIIFGQQI